MSAYITNDVFVIIALPQSFLKGRPGMMVNAVTIVTGGDRFKEINDVTQSRCVHTIRGIEKIDNAVQVIGHVQNLGHIKMIST